MIEMHEDDTSDDRGIETQDEAQNPPDEVKSGTVSPDEGAEEEQ